MSKPRSGGGATSNKVVSSRAPKAEPRSRAISPAAVSRIGLKQGNHADTGTVRVVTRHSMRGEAMRPPPGRPITWPLLVLAAGGRSTGRAHKARHRPHSRPGRAESC